MTATTHFAKRVAERIGPEVNAAQLAFGIVSDIRDERGDLVEFVARVNKQGLRLFRFRVPCRGVFYALVDTSSMVCVTVLPPGFTVPCQGKGRIKLKETDL